MILNKARVDELFRSVAVLIGSEDVVPVSAALDLFEKDAIDFACSLKSGRYWNAYYIAGTFYCMYLTYSGFQAAASYCNVMKFREVKE